MQVEVRSSQVDVLSSQSLPFSLCIPLLCSSHRRMHSLPLGLITLPSPPHMDFNVQLSVVMVLMEVSLCINH